jgi:RHS repeat-associated protein
MAYPSVDYNYTPDRLNRSSVVENGAVINFDANGMNQYVGIGGQTVQYDQNFNLSLLNGWSYGYDAEKHLMVTSNGGGSSASFVYDGLGRCVKRTINGVSTRFVYDGWKAIMEFSPQTNHLVAWNVYGPGADEILWRWVEGVGDMRYQHDIHGNVTALLGFYGGVIERYTYDVFGSPTILSTNNTQLSTSAYGNRFMFQGREYFPELGIYDYRHRMYHPGLGRFLQTDPTGFDAGDMNLFRYCGDDPIDRSDPIGLVSEDNRYSSLTSMGGGDWVKGSEGLSAWDYAHGMGSNRAQAGMDSALIMSWHSKEDTPKSRPTAHDQSLKSLRLMIKGSEDSTTKIVQRGNGPIHGVTYSGETMTTQKMVHEYVKIEKGDRVYNFTHVHTRAGKSQNSLTDYDQRLLKNEKRPIYFTTRDWVRTRYIEYEGNTYRGNYIIIQPNGAMMPYLDPQLSLR